jgi:hypothetical protein
MPGAARALPVHHVFEAHQRIHGHAAPAPAAQPVHGKRQGQRDRLHQDEAAGTHLQLHRLVLAAGVDQAAEDECRGQRLLEPHDGTAGANGVWGVSGGAPFWPVACSLNLRQEKKHQPHELRHQTPMLERLAHLLLNSTTMLALYSFM